MLAAGITPNKVRAMNEYGVDFGRVARFRAQEAILRGERDDGECTSFRDAAN